MTDVAKPKELAIPFAAHETSGATEVLRAWVFDNGLHVSLQRGFDDPEVWGVLLTDVARHVARIFEKEGVCSEQQALDRIKLTLDSEWDGATDAGVTQAVQ